jgi:hypothetical protein
MPILVDVYKHLKIIHAQVKMLLVCVNTYNAKKKILPKSQTPQSPIFVGLQTQYRKNAPRVGFPPC